MVVWKQPLQVVSKYLFQSSMHGKTIIIGLYIAGFEEESSSIR
jgi:hypothetical protein